MILGNMTTADHDSQVIRSDAQIDGVGGCQDSLEERLHCRHRREWKCQLANPRLAFERICL
jgi:hypothetical protein